MNKLKFLPLLCIFCMLFTFTSCENEDDIKGSLIEGIWMFGDEEEGFGICLVLNKDKTGMMIEGVFDEEKEVRYFRYTFDSKNMLLTITQNGEWPYEIDVYRLTPNQLITIEEDGEIATFKRYNGSIKDLEKLLDMDL